MFRPPSILNKFFYVSLGIKWYSNRVILQFDTNNVRLQFFAGTPNVYGTQRRETAAKAIILELLKNSYILFD